MSGIFSGPTSAPLADRLPGPRIFVSAGDVSGDLHAAALVACLRRHAAAEGLHLDLMGLGGPQMQAAGVRLVANNQGISSVGIVEALPYLRSARLLKRSAVEALARWRPELAVLIDYPGFNVPLAARLKASNVPVIYYIPPEEWLWSTRGNRLLDRTEKIARSITRVLAVHPVEAEFYRSAGCDVELVGHPLVDLHAGQPLDRARARAILGIDPDRRVLAILPASRMQEIRMVWPVLAEAAARLLAHMPGLRLLLPVSTPGIAAPLRTAVEREVKRLPALGDALMVLERGSGTLSPATLAIAAADVALTKSGSATVEIALRGVPQVVAYRMSRGTIWIGRRLLGLTEADIERFSLVNHILQQSVVPELLLHRATPEAIAEQAWRLFQEDSEERSRQLTGYALLRERLGAPGTAERAARSIWGMLSRYRGGGQGILKP